MPVIKLTIENIRKADAIDRRDTIYRDTELKGFSLKVTPANSKIFFYQYRIGGRAGFTKKITIGKFPGIKVDEARKIALQYAAELAKKTDPQETVRKSTADKIKSHANSFEKVYELYKEKRLNQNKSARLPIGVFEREFLPTLGKVALKSVTREDIVTLVDKIYQRKAYYASNRALTYLKTFFRWTLGQGYLQVDPTYAMQKPFNGETARDRVLNPTEMLLLWQQFELIGYPFGDVLQLLLLTGQRREEVTGMRWVDLDFEKGLWSIPREFTKNKQRHEIPLIGRALQIVKRQIRQIHLDQTTNQQIKSDYVFTTTGTTPISGWGHIKARLDKFMMDKDCTIEDWRIHDLRRTFSSYLGDMGYFDSDIGILLNHQNRGITAVYNRSAYLNKKKEMLQKWDQKLKELIF